MPMLATLALQYAKPIAIMLAIGSVIAYCAILHHRLSSAQAQAAAAASQVEAYKSANAACEATVARQNAAVAQLRADADAAAKLAASRQANLAADADRAASASVAKSEAVIAQSNVGTTCAEAIRWAATYASTLSKWDE